MRHAWWLLVVLVSSLDASPAPAAANSPANLALQAPLTPSMMENGGGNVDFNGCSNTELDRRRLLIAVVTAPGHSLAREAIRSTWAKNVAATMGDRADLKFFIGKLPANTPDYAGMNGALNAEKDMRRLDDFTEDYHNLAWKSMSIFRLAYKECYAGVLKIDDDVFLHAERVLPYLDRFDWNTLYSGQIMRNNPVIKDPKGRWYAYDQYPHETWPDFANGPCYFLGRAALKHIAQNADILPKFRMEDVSVAVWVDPLQLNKQDMPSTLMHYSIVPDSLWISPVSYSEIYRIQNGEVFTLEVCEPPRETACLCNESPHFSKEQIGSCWAHFSESPYADVIPRMV